MAIAQHAAHLALQVADIEKSIAFYHQLCDYAEVHRWTMPNGGTAVLLATPAQGLMIELFDSSCSTMAQGRQAKNSEEIVHGALLHLAFSVPDATLAYKEALQLGAISCREPLLVSLNGIDYQTAFVYGPDGECIEFIESHAVPRSGAH